MSRLKWTLGMRAAVALLMFGTAAAAFQAKAPETKTAEKTDANKASLSGSVLDSKDGKPVSGVSLLLAGTGGLGAPSSARSDDEGKFTFKNLDAGDYILIADHAKYARQTYGSRNGLMGGTIIRLTTGQDLRELTFKLAGNAVASGRVLDEDGEPMPKILVAAVKPMYQHGKRQFMPLATAVTNDLGEYRLANLAAGRYLISASTLGSVRAPKTPGSDAEQTYTATYYPNSPDASGAAPVEVAPGGDMGGLDIKLGKSKSVKVKGKVAGAPAGQNVTVRLVPKGAGVIAMLTGKSSPINPEGFFEITGVTPGSYTLRAGDPTGMKAMGNAIEVQVGDESKENLILTITPNLEMKGALLAEGPDQKPAGGISYKGTRVLLEAVEGLVLAPPNTQADAGGGFTFSEVPPDRYYVRVMNSPDNSYVDSAMLGTARMEAQGLDFTAGSGERLTVKLRLDGARVDGVIKGSDDKPIGGVTVALIPDSKDYLMFQSTLTDQNGGYTLKNIKPGDYRLIAWEEVEPNAFQDPDFVKKYESAAQTVSLKGNDRKTISTKAIPRDQR